VGVGRVVDIDPVDVKHRPDGDSVGQIDLWLIRNLEHLELSTLRKVAQLPRYEAVETCPGVPVLGLVDIACDWVNGNGFVHEAAHICERDWLGRLEGRDCKDPAMRLRKAVVRSRCNHGLFTGEPRTPGSGSASTVRGRVMYQFS